MKHLLNINTNSETVSKDYDTQNNGNCYVKNPTSKYVDLGLSSGLKWAACNIGAQNENEHGLYFQWGAVKPNTEGTPYDWEHAPFNNGASDFDETYFNAHKDEWLVNNVLKPEYDAAVAAGKGRIPTPTEFQTLRDETLWVWSPGGKVGVKKTNESGGETIDYVVYPAGYFVFKVKSKFDKGARGSFPKDETTGILNGFSKTEGVVYYAGAHSVTEGDVTTIEDGDTHIFLPASGYASGTGVTLRGSDGYYWSSSLYTSYSGYGRHLYFHSGYVGPQNYSGSRCLGFCVRSVAEN